MRWQLASIGIYRQGNGELQEYRVDPFTAFVGAARTGKSSVLDIVDYCLMSASCPVAKGLVRDSLSAVGVLLDNGDERLSVVRPIPEGNQLSTNVAFVDGGSKAALPKALPRATWNSRAARDAISEFTNIEAMPYGDPETSESPDAIGIRHCVPYVLQPQDVIASRHLIFPHLGDNVWRRRAIVEAVDYFFGIAGLDDIKVRAELRSIRRDLARLERHSSELTNLRTSGLDRGEALLDQALALNMIAPDAPAGPSELWARLRLAAGGVARSPDVDRGERNRLQNEVARLGEEHQKLTIRLDEARSFLAASENAAGVLERQRSRLAVGLLFPDVGTQRCPLCHEGTLQADDLKGQITGALADMDNRDAPRARLRALAERQQLEIEAARRNIEEQLDRVRRQLRTLEESGAPRTDRDVLMSRAVLKGRIEEYLTAQTREEDGTDTERAALMLKYKELETRWNQSRVAEKRQAVQERLGKWMTAAASDIDVEFAGREVRLNLDTLLVELRFGPSWVALAELGSGANWLGYHLIAATLVHKLFSDIGSPVPGLLMLDQPSQVWFPDEQQWGRREREALSRAYKFVVEQARPIGLQVVVTDHARAPARTNGFSKLYDWSAESGLVPSRWIGMSKA